MRECKGSRPQSTQAPRSGGGARGGFQGGPQPTIAPVAAVRVPIAVVRECPP
jgi:hypothetical protein